MAIGTTAAILGSAALGAGSSILSSNAANKGQQQAANASQQAADQATAEQRRQYDLSRTDNAPWLQAGQGALSQLSQLYNLNGQGAQGTNWNAYLAANPDVQQAIAGGAYGGQGGLTGAAQRHYQEYGQAEGRQVQAASNLDPFMASPDYQFRQNEQMRALTARNAALGIQDSGAAQKSALQQSGNLASGEFNNFANRLSALAGVGQTAANQNAQLGQNFAGAVGGIAQNNAQNLSSSYQNMGAIQGQNLNNFANIGSGLLNGFATPAYGKMNKKF
jgi:hypothetical protein